MISIDSGSIFVHSLTGGGTTTGVLTNVDNYFMTASPALVNNGTGVAITGSDGYGRHLQRRGRRRQERR